MAKELHFDKEAREKMMVGIDAVTKLVGSSLGPKGRCVVVERTVTNPATKEIIRLTPVTTKDGVSIARAISLSDPTENMGCDLIREAASQTVNKAGDGTTASVVLARALIHEGMSALDNGSSPVFIRYGIDKGVARVIEVLDEMKQPCNGRELQIARIAANGDEEIAATVVRAIEMAGENGIVSVEASRSDKTEVDFSPGMRLDSGLRYQDFVTDGSRGECVLDNPYILLHERRIPNFAAVGKLIEAVAESGRSILILSEEFEVPFIAFLLTNLAKLKSCAVVAPYFGERRKDMLKDLAVFTGGTAITDELGLDTKTLGLEVLGQADKVVVTKGHTTIIGGKSSSTELMDRINYLKLAIQRTENPYEKEVFADRLAKLDGGVAVIKIAAATESESKEKRDRTEDAVLSVKCARAEGIVPGGGVALLRCAQDEALLSMADQGYPESDGVKVLIAALYSPITQLLNNGGYDTNDIIEYLKAAPKEIGYDALGGKFENMFEAGIVDPVKVVKESLKNAASLAGTFLTASGTITNLQDGEKK